MKKLNLIIIVAILIALGLAMRLLPHPANFTPIAAIALFAGYYLPKKLAVILPIAAMLLGDLFIGFYEWKLMLAVYGSLVLAGIIGLAFRKNRNVLTVAASSLLASLSFFLITNFAVWLFSAWYTKDLSGLMLSYSLAVPFFRNTLMGNLFFVGVLFGGFELAKITLANKSKSQTISRPVGKQTFLI